ncbi:MAG TPA: hypothetical protein VFW64_12225 [Pseudonocardiaceae bacterium]|nr:hypothetical protein [Pseudonocardiaceae bacterium]
MPTFPQYPNAALVVGANIVSKSAAYTAASGDIVIGDASGAGFTVTLPPVATGGPVTVQTNVSTANVITLKTSDSSKIDNVAGATGRAVAAAQYSTLTVVSDGANWWTVAH